MACRPLQFLAVLQEGELLYFTFRWLPCRRLPLLLALLLPLLTPVPLPLPMPQAAA